MQFAPTLSAFVEQVARYERALLSGEHKVAAEALDEIQAEHGYSLWLIKQRIAQRAEAAGLEWQKAYVAEVRRSSPGNGVAPYVAYYASIRNEETVTAGGFVAQFTRQLGALNLPTDFAQYLAFHIAPELRLTPETVADVMRHEHAGAVVDGYETLLLLTRCAIATGMEDALPSLGGAVAALESRVSDPRLTTLAIELGLTPKNDPRVSRPSIEALNRQLRDDYVGAVAAAAEGIRGDPGDTDLIDTAASCIALLGGRGADESGHSDAGELGLEREALVTRLVTRLAAVRTAGEQSDDAAAQLRKVALNYVGRPWADFVGASVDREQDPDPRAATRDVSRFAAAGAPTVHPLRLRMLESPRLRAEYGRRCTRAGLGAPADLYVEAFAPSDSTSLKAELVGEFGAEQRLLVAAELCVLKGDFESALASAQLLMASLSSYAARSGMRLQSHALLRLGRTVECAKLVAKHVAKNWRMHDAVPIRDLVPLLAGDVERELAPTLTLAILYDLHGTFVDDTYDSRLHFAFEDVLDAAGVERPSELGTRASQFDRDELLYFFQHICVEQVMDRAITRFAGSREVIDERIAVCRVLASYDPENDELYQREIRELLSGLMVRRRLREVEESKIYVDRDGVVKAADAALRESFNRYTSFLRHGIDVHHAGGVDPARERVRAAGPVEGLVGLPLPQNESRELLRTLVVGVRDEFVSNSAYGLDGFLSTRIRHGTLVNQLRSALESAHLITPRDEATDQYIADEYWAERLTSAHPDDLNQLAGELATFARAFDRLVLRVRTEWIQVRRNPGDLGFFDFVPEDEQLRVVAESTTADTPFGEFLGGVLLMLDDMLDRSLATMREALNTQGKQEIAALLAALQERVALLADRIDTSEVNHAIATARTGVQLSFDRVAEWFYRSGPRGFEPFPLEDAVRVAEVSLTSAGRPIQAHVTSTITGGTPKIRGQLLPPIVDLFFILFDNVVRYDGLPAPHEVRITISEEDEWICCTVENVVAAGAITPEGEAKLERSRAALREVRYLTAAATEGGSGLCKVGKIIAHDYRLPPRLDFGYDGDQFVVNFALRANLINDPSRSEVAP